MLPVHQQHTIMLRQKQAQQCKPQARIVAGSAQRASTLLRRPPGATRQHLVVCASAQVQAVTKTGQDLDQAYNEQMSKQVRRAGEEPHQADPFVQLVNTSSAPSAAAAAPPPHLPPSPHAPQTHTHSQMGWSEPFSYHFDRGLYFHEVYPRLLCGTQARSPEEVEALAQQHGVVTMVNLQQDKDMQHWG